MGCIKQGQVLKVGLSVARPGLDQVVAAEQWHCLPGSLEGPHSFQRQAFPSSSSSACALMSYHCCPNTFSWQPKLILISQSIVSLLSAPDIKKYVALSVRYIS